MTKNNLFLRSLTKVL